MTTQIGLGIQPGTYKIDISSGSFSAYSSSNLNGSFTLVGTWEGGFGTGTFEINGQWTKSLETKPTSITQALQIYDNITTSWATNTTTLRDTAVNLVSNGGMGQVSGSVAPILISVTTKVPTGTNPQWKVTFVKNSWYTYDRSSPKTKYLFGESSSAYNTSNYYSLNNNTAGTFFDIGQNNYYTSFGGSMGTIVGENIDLVSDGETIVSGEKVPSAATSKSVNKSNSGDQSVSPTSYISPIQVQATTPTEEVQSAYFVPSNNHIGRNILGCQTHVEIDSDLSTEKTSVYRIECAPPGLFEGENYVIIPSSDPTNGWKYFYHLSAGTGSVEPSSDGTYVVNSVYAEFPTSGDPTDSDIWQTGVLNSNFQFDLDFPIDLYQVYKNQYIPRESKIFAWAGNQHFGIIVGDPNDDNNTKKYLIY